MTDGNSRAHPFSPDYYSDSGLTKREYFAAMAMQGMLANSIDKQQGKQPSWDLSHIDMAEECVVMADALIESLNKTP